MATAKGKARVKEPLPDLDYVLSEANPDWSQKQLSTVHSKLEQVNITNAEQLQKILKAPGSALNDQLRDAGLKTFSADTLRALRRCLHVKRRKAKPKKAVESSGQASTSAVSQEERICWTCPACDELNNEGRKLCNNCGASRPHEEDPEPEPPLHTEEAKYNEEAPKRSVCWICVTCAEENSEMRQKCNNCGEPRFKGTTHTEEKTKHTPTTESTSAPSSARAARAARPRYSIVGTWNEWRPTEMMWDEGRQAYVFHVRLGVAGWESFQILLEGDWQKCFHPDCEDACPHERYELCGPDGRGHGKNWTIGRHFLDHGTPGTEYEIRVNASATGSVSLVGWQQLPNEAKQEASPSPESPKEETGSSQACDDTPTPWYTAADTRRPTNLKTDVAPVPDMESDDGSNLLEGIPTLDECLRALDEEEERESRKVDHLILTRAAEKGIQVGQLDVQDRVIALLDRLEGIEQMTAAKLLEEYEQRGFAAMNDLSRTELLPLVKEVLIWEELSLAPLQDLCSRRGLRVQDDEPRSELFAWLADSTWEEMGIPVRKFESYAVARRVLAKIRGHDRSSIEVLQTQCSELSLPFEEKSRTELVAQLKQVFIWNELPSASLRKECEALGVVNGDIETSTEDSQERLKLLSQLKHTMWSDRWQTRGIPAQHLGDTGSSTRLIQQIDRLQAMGKLSLKTEHAKKGIPFDPSMTDEVLMRRLRNVIIWEQMPIEELWEVCQDHGVFLDVVCMDEVQERKESVEGLTLVMLRATWEANKIPAERIRSLKLTDMILQQVLRFRDMSTLSLKDEYDKLKVPFDSNLGIDELADRLRSILVWKHLPMADLQEECSMLGVSLPASAERNDCIGQLVIALWSITWKQHSIPAERLGQIDVIAEILSDMCRWQGMGMEDLGRELCNKNLPSDLYLDRHELIDFLKLLQIWERFPLEELQKECREKDVSVSKQSGMNCTADARNAMCTALATKTCLTYWENQGIPVSSLEDFQASAKLAAEYKRIEQKSLIELLDWYTGEGYPDGKGMEKMELERLMKNFRKWQALPLAALQEECSQHDLQMDEFAREASDDDALRQLCATRLLLSQRMNVWEAKGFQTQRIGKVEAVFDMMANYAVLQSMSNAELKQIVKDVGLPQETGMERADLLKGLRTVLVWGRLPLEELEKECKDRNLPVHVENPFADEQNRHAELQQRLIVDMGVDSCRALFEHKGVPVARLGSLQAAHVAEQFDSFSAMNLKQLRDKTRALGIPVLHNEGKEELERILKLVTLWSALPVAELLHECHSRNVPVEGIHVTTGFSFEKQQCAKLIDKLMFKLCAPTFQHISVPTEQLRTFAACANVASAWSKIDIAGEPTLKQKYSHLGVPPHLLGVAELRERLKKAAIWKEMPLEDLQEVCRIRGMSGISAYSWRQDLIQRLAEYYWPTRQSPPQPPQQPWNSSNEIFHCFSTLGLSPLAGYDEVKKAYKKLALKYHPDKNPGAHQERYAKMFQNVAQAYERLAEHFKSSR